jgi:hypothetical protein
MISSTSLISVESNYLEKEKKIIETINNNYPSENSALLANWSLDEGSGTIAHDYSGHGLDGIIHGTTWTNGHSGYALNFDGDNDYIILDEYSVELGFNKTDDYKISAWFKTESTHTGTIYMISDNSDPIPVFYVKLKDNGTIEVSVHSTETCDVTVNSEMSYNDGSWHYIEGIYHGTDTYPTMDLYIDNEFIASKTDWLCDLGSNQFKSAKIGMASYDSLDMYEGLIDEVKVYKRPGGNQPPNKPKISGPASGTIHEIYNYSFYITDPEGDPSYLGVDWGDNNTTSWLGPYDSYKNVVLNHSWPENGIYEIKARLRDTFDVGEWEKFNVTMGNIAPYKPTIEGPISGNKGTQLEFSFKSTDPNGHDIKYNIDWGDGTLTKWTDFYKSGEKVIVKYAYSHQGVYSIKANAIDIYEKESGWSNPFIVNITEKALLFGIISNKVMDENFIYFDAKLLFYIGLKPIKTNLYFKGEKLLASYEYLGNITDNYIYGVFNTAII